MRSLVANWNRASGEMRKQNLSKSRGVGETPRADMGVPGGRVKPNMQQSQVGRGANAERERSSTSEERAATGNVQECGCSLMLC